jgi:hypothetical protein
VPGRIGEGVRRAPAPSPPRYGRRHWLAAPPYRGDESNHLWRSASATAYVERAGAVFVAGREELRVVREEPADGRHPTVWFTPRAVPKPELASRLAGERRERPHAGWSTWDAHGPRLSGAALLEDLDAIECRFGDTIDVVNVDDGWQHGIGDWLPRDRAMAHALGEVAGARRLCLWWSPFVVHREASLASEHPDWILRDRFGQPVVVLARDDPWEAWALDLSNLDVLGWLRATAERLAGYGAQLLKCDFLYASAFTADAARAGTCADPLVTAEEVHRRALAAIAAAGPAIVACGAPLWASAGLVHAMRVGPDVGPRWWRPPPPGLASEDAGGCLANAWAAASRRHWMHGALWLNDPDSVFLRAGPAGDRWLSWVAQRGLPLMLGDPLGPLTRSERTRWERAVDRQRAAWAAGAATSVASLSRVAGTLPPQSGPCEDASRSHPRSSSR